MLQMFPSVAFHLNHEFLNNICKVMFGYKKTVPIIKNQTLIMDRLMSHYGANLRRIPKLILYDGFVCNS